MDGRRTSRTNVRCRAAEPADTVTDMNLSASPALHPRASVTVEAAADLVNVDTATIRGWSRAGSIEVEWRGDMEVVRLDQVRALAATSSRRRPAGAALRERLDGATLGPTRSVTDLQALARGRRIGS